MKHHIALICDDNYCLPTIVCIQSLLNTMKYDSQYVVHVCTFGLSKDNCTKFHLLRKNNAEIIIDIFSGVQCENRLQQISQKTHVTPTALIKFELPNYFKTLDKILYLDGDIIIKNNIDDLFKLDIDGQYLAASYDFYCRLNKIKYSFKRDYNDFYFNSGVMLLNLKMMREDDVTSKLWYYKTHMAKTQLMDQESLNAVCGKKTKALSLIWNFNPVFYRQQYIEEINHVYSEKYHSLDQMKDDIRIIHYVGKKDKPWIYKEATFRDYWDNVYKTTFQGGELKLKEFHQERSSIFKSVSNKIKLFGINGFMCFLINKIVKNDI
ncbi:MAG: glycosyltransferase family 8 protein [Bacteroidaceae bacterium]|nr:glycosyltransferase family 8 protein [Bacteroidaceae bacterium]